jgi:hypothetical protein
MRPVGAGTRRMGRTTALRTVLATRTIALRGTIGTAVTAAFIAISRWALAAGRTFSPHAARAFVGIVAWTVVTAITSPTAAAVFAITIPVVIAITRGRADFIAVIIPRSETAVMWRAVETAISQAASERWTRRMVGTWTIEVAPFGWTCKTIEAIAIEFASTRRTGEAVTIHSGSARRLACEPVAIAVPAFRTTAVALTLAAPIVGWTSKTVTFEFTSTRTSKMFALKLAATWAGEAISFRPSTFRATCESLSLVMSAFRTAPRTSAFETATFGRARKAIESFTIETAAWRTIETIAVVAAALVATSKLAAIGTTTIASAAIHGTGRPTRVESSVRWTSRSSTLEPGAGRSRTTCMFHAFMDRFGQSHKLVLAQLAVLVFVKLIKEFGRIWALRTTARFVPTL